LVRCEEYYEKWKRDPNWCEKCPTAVYYIDKYIELTEKFPALKNLSERAVRPLVSIPLEDKDLPTIADTIAYQINESPLKRVTHKDVEEIIRKVKGKEKAPSQPSVQLKYKGVWDKLEPYYPVDILDAVGSRISGKLTLERWKRLVKSFVASMWEIIHEDRELMIKLFNVWEEKLQG